MNRGRMFYVMFLFTVYDPNTSQYVGSEVNDRTEQETVTRKGISLFTLAGMTAHDAKALVKVMLISALSLNPVTATTPNLILMDTVLWFFVAVIIVTVLCISLGYIAVLRRQLQELRGEEFQYRWNDSLTQVLSLLKKGKERIHQRNLDRNMLNVLKKNFLQMTKVPTRLFQRSSSDTANLELTKFLNRSCGTKRYQVQQLLQKSIGVMGTSSR